MARILLIEDEELVRFTLRRILEDVGYEVFEASDGEEGVSKFKEMASKSKPTDVVVTDIFMPKQDGFETINEIKKIKPYAKIVAITGGGVLDSKEFLKMANFLGANEILAKPFLPGDLLEAVDRCLQ